MVEAPEPRQSEGVERKESLERLPSAECLIVLGGGIDQVTIRDKETGEEERVWKPSRYVVETDPKIQARDKRSGIRKQFTKDEELTKDLVVHGGTAHLLAAIQYLDEMKERDSLPQITVFAAGRPDYIENVTTSPFADEGFVMQSEFDRRTSRDSFPGMQTDFHGTGSKNSAGDLLNGLISAYKKNLMSAVVVLTKPRMERTKALYESLCDKFPKLKSINVTFLAAENLLRRRYAGTSAESKFEAIQRHFDESELAKETEKREKQGIEDLKAGRYNLRIEAIDTSAIA